MGYFTSVIELQIDELMDRVTQAGDDPQRRAAALEEYLAFAYAHEDEDWFDIVSWSEDLADCYVKLGRPDDAVRVTRAAVGSDPEVGPETLCDLAEKLMRAGIEPHARTLWDEVRTEFPKDIWVYVQAGIEYSDIRDHATALSWLTPGMELALTTGDPESALEQLVPLRATCRSALNLPPDALQARGEAGT